MLTLLLNMCIIQGFLTCIYISILTSDFIMEIVNASFREVSIQHNFNSIIFYTRQLPHYKYAYIVSRGTLQTNKERTSRLKNNLLITQCVVPYGNQTHNIQRCRKPLRTVVFVPILIFNFIDFLVCRRLGYRYQCEVGQVFVWSTPWLITRTPAVVLIMRPHTVSTMTLCAVNGHTPPILVRLNACLAVA